jgi:RNA recognition motif-containing protein
MFISLTARTPALTSSFASQLTATDEDLRTMCRKYGQIVSCKAVIDRRTGACAGMCVFRLPVSVSCASIVLVGYGFVLFHEEDCARAAVESLSAVGVHVRLHAFVGVCAMWCNDLVVRRHPCISSTPCAPMAPLWYLLVGCYLFQ